MTDKMPGEQANDDAWERLEEWRKARESGTPLQQYSVREHEAAYREALSQLASVNETVRAKDPDSPAVPLALGLSGVMTVVTDWLRPDTLPILSVDRAAEQIIDALAGPLRIWLLPRCQFPGCQARYDETLAGTKDEQPGEFTGWRFFDYFPEPADLPAHQHTASPTGRIHPRDRDFR